ncbi:hypothetical protein GGR44_000099 [Sphingobium fontiphilum]|uniref:Lipoprotein n=1 Tax=Sphingobium fontiphilum TaxID=944425 RepID=A0A7W6DC28_9SPHN|nr:hypothetical protein [Sphingobium fontiphilum]MBB3980468.1 hypothetical protein [Sphingobium fontiphilum]
MIFFRTFILPLATMALASCNEVQVCQICLENDASRPLSQREASQVYIYHNRAKLPSLARNIFYKERCGIDCKAIMRFDVPSEKAGEVAETLSGQTMRPLDQNDLSNFLLDGDSGVSWWLPPATKNLVGASGNIGGGQLARIAIIDRGAISRIYLSSWQM